MFSNRFGNFDDSPGMPPLDQLQGRPIGRVLTKMGKVTREQVIEALMYQKEHGGLLGEVMVKLGFIEPDDIVAALAGQRGERPLPPPGSAG
jgi:type IV pilus assembly protein PilB